MRVRAKTKTTKRGGAKASGPNAIDLLVKDHRTVEALFKRFEKIKDKGGKEKKALVREIIQELSVHAAIEEQVLYPASKKVKNTKDITLEALEEHHVVKWTLSELEKLNPSNERYDAKVSVLMESVRHHVEEEESELFPKLRRALGAQKLAQLGAALAQAKEAAPRTPMPRAPDEPPGNLKAAKKARANGAGRRSAQARSRSNGQSALA